MPFLRECSVQKRPEGNQMALTLELENSKKHSTFLSKRKENKKCFFSSLHLFFIAQSKSPQSGWQKNAKLSNDCATANPAQKHSIYIRQ